MARTCLMVCIAIVTLACNDRGHSATEETADRDRAAIEAMYKARLELIVGAADPTRAAEAYVRDVTDDAVWMPPNAPAVNGRLGVLAWAREFFGTYELQIDTQEIEPTEIGGTLAIRRFTSTGRYVPRAGGAPIPFDQKYVDVLRRDADGVWKLAAHMWSSNNVGPTIWR